MSSHFLVNRLHVIMESVTISLCPTKLSESAALENIHVVINNLEIHLSGYYSNNDGEASEFPLIYSPKDLLEDIQFLENSSYYIEIESPAITNISIINKTHNNSFTPYKKQPSFSDNIKKGTLNWKSYVGKDFITIAYDEQVIFSLPVEIRASKVNYIEDYKNMVDKITENLADLIWNENSPSSLKMSKEFDQEPSLIESFFFIREAMTPNYIPQSWQIITESPTTKQIQDRRDVTLGEVRQIDSQTLVSIISRPEYLVESSTNLYTIPSLSNRLPEVVNVPYKKLTLDTPENQFLLYWFSELHSLLNEILVRYSDNKTLINVESKEMLSRVNEILHHSMFNEVSNPVFFDLNNLALRRLPGYSDIFNIYEQYSKHGSLSWSNYFDLLYNFEAKPVYDIYELWVLFELIDTIQSISTGNIKYNISRGNKSTIRGITAPFNSLTIKLVYQKYCSVSTKNQYLTSYSIPMIPDYVITLWDGKDYLGGIALDAKYRFDSVDSFASNTSDNIFEDTFDRMSLTNTDFRQAKPLDLVKMHSYKDSIRGILGSFVIFPGKDAQAKLYNEQLTLLPSIGALPLYPTDANSQLSLDQRQSIRDFLLTAIAEISL